MKASVWHSDHSRLCLAFASSADLCLAAPHLKRGLSLAVFHYGMLSVKFDISGLSRHHGKMKAGHSHHRFRHHGGQLLAGM